MSAITPRIVLASTSPHRLLLLTRLQLPFESESPDVDESEVKGEPPRLRALRLAVAKARSVAGRHPGDVVIGSDQVASLEVDGRTGILRKPGDRDACLGQLTRMSGREVRFDTAVTVIFGDREQSHIDLTQVRFRDLTLEEIADYVEREPSFDCAGGFKCEGLGVTLFESVATDDPTALVGLPLIGLCRLLREAGVRV